MAPAGLVQGGWVAGCAHRWDIAPSDHAAVELLWQPPLQAPRGRWRWRFPDGLLGDAPFVARTIAALRVFLEGWQPASGAEVAAPARAKWEALKVLLRQLAVEHVEALAAGKAAARKQARALECSTRAALLRAPPAVAAAAYLRWRSAVGRLQAALGVGARAGQLGSGPVDLRWEVDGEQGSRWFHRLAKQGGGAPSGMECVTVVGPGGSEVRRSVHDRGGTVQVGEELSAFFDGRRGGLFAKGRVDAAAQADMLDALDMFVPEQEARDCLGPGGDGLLTIACLEQALAKVQGGRAPGSDGLTFEVYKGFWGVLAGPLVECFNEAFADDGDLGPQLTLSQRSGVIALIHKGGGKPKDQVAAHRPITLLNCDYKLVARVLVHRLVPAAEAVVDPGQTAFLPGRWIGDNILHHLELVDYCQAEAVPGCILFLDFEKAYDRLDRGWLFQCMERQGFPPAVVRWVRLMLSGSRAGVLYHGHLSPWFDILSGAAQGSPLSPLLYVLAAQPLAAKLRRLQAEGAIDGIRLPDASLAPPCHQHADDTSIHVASRAGAAVAMQLAVVPFGRASNAVVSVPKTHGMLLGPGSAGVEGLDAVTRVVFVAAAAHLRHLGILLSAGSQAAATRVMFEKRLTAVRLRVRDWCKFDLSYLGRLHVAKQVLASSLYFHASFFFPPQDLLDQLVDCIDLFVVMGRLAEGVVPPLQHVPCAAIECLSREMGGLRRADIPVQLGALHAKVAALMLHPRRHPWKMLMRRAFERMVPGLGPAALVSQLRPVRSVGRSERLVRYWHALHALAPHRGVEPCSLSVHHALRERLASNCRIGGSAAPLGMLASGPRLQALARLGAGNVPAFELTVGGLRAALSAGDEPTARVAGRLQALVGEVAWQQALVAPQLPPPEWWQSPCGQWVYQHGGPCAYAVRADGRLAPATGACPNPGESLVGWEPACVCWCPLVKGQSQLVDLPPPAHCVTATNPGRPMAMQAYLLGPWRSVWVDPNAWRVGGQPLTHFVVRAAAARLLVLGHCRRGKGFVLGQGQPPRMWGGGPAGGVEGLEAGWAAAFAARLAAAPAVDGSVFGRRVRRRLGPPEGQHGLQGPAYASRWAAAVVDVEGPMRAARVHPLQRAADGRAARGDRAGELVPCDSVDVLAVEARLQAAGGIAAVGVPGWREAYKGLWLPRLDRPTRYFGWLLLHGGLRCGAAGVAWAPVGCRADLVDFCCCRAAGCAVGACPPLDTYTHAFLLCPVVAPAVEWLRQLWAGIGGQVPPLDVRVLVVGDHTVWDPGGGKDFAELWHHLRLLFCRAVWALHSRRVALGHAFTAAAVVGVVAGWVGSAVRLDWLRVGVGLGAAGGRLPSGCVVGQRHALTRAQFERRWCLGGVLASVVSGPGRASVRVCVPRALPVAGPVGG